MQKITIAAVLAATVLFVAQAWAGGADKSCGEMTAEQAGMPAKLGELLNAYADEAEAHAAFMAATNKTKESAAEVEGTKKLAVQYRETAASLTKTADAMKAAANWPKAGHDVKALFADAKVKAAMDKTRALQKEIGDMIAKPAAAPAPAKK